MNMKVINYYISNIVFYLKLQTLKHFFFLIIISLWFAQNRRDWIKY